MQRAAVTRALKYGLLGTGLAYGSCFMHLTVHTMGQRLDRVTELRQLPRAKRHVEAKLGEARTGLMSALVGFYQAREAQSGPTPLQAWLADRVTFSDPLVTLHGPEEVWATRPRLSGWFTKRFDARLIDTTHADQSFVLTFRQMYSMKGIKFNFTLWNQVFVQLEGPLGEEKIVDIREHWSGVGLVDNPLQYVFRRLNGKLSAHFSCGTDRLMFMKYFLSYDGV